MRRRRPRSLALSAIILVAALIYTQFENRSTGVKPAEPGALPEGAFSGRVVAVTDGDTIKVLHQNREVKVRLHGVDCPEKKQDYGTRAKQFTSDVVFGKDVNVEVRSHDRYGRVVGWVSLRDGKVLNVELVREGYAWWYKEYAPVEKSLSDAEAEARSNRAGLWKAGKPIAPWDFRKKARQGAG